MCRRLVRYLTLGGLNALPQTGDKNTIFGVFKSACCGAEIVITKGAAFPVCPNHPKQKTTWNQIEITTEGVLVINNKANNKSDPAA